MTTKVLTPQEMRAEEGQWYELNTEEARAKRARINRMLLDLREKRPRISVDRARLLTESLKIPLILFKC